MIFPWQMVNIIPNTCVYGCRTWVVRIKASACTHPGRMLTKPHPWTRFSFSCVLDLLQLANMFMHQMKEAQLHTEFLQIYHAQLPWCWENVSCLLMNRHYKCINKTIKKKYKQGSQNCLIMPKPPTKARYSKAMPTVNKIPFYCLYPKFPWKPAFTV